MHGHFPRTVAVALVAIGPLFFVLSAAAQESTNTFKLREGSFLRSFRPVVEHAHRSIVRFERLDKHDQEWIDASLGAVVDPAGLVVSKASELFGPVRASMTQFSNLDARIIAVDTRHDLALIQIGSANQFEQSPLEPIRWSENSARVGHWVVTADIDRMPASVGVLSVPARIIPPSKERPVLGITMDREAVGSPIIDAVNRDGAADRAGLQSGDIITRINGRLINSQSDLQRAVQRYHPGDTVDVTLTREGKTLQQRATLQHIPPMTDDPENLWNDDLFRSRWSSRWAMMNELGSTLSVRRDNFPTAAQHDTVLRPQDCGGAALNLKGEAIGISIARSGRTESLMIPSSVVQEVVNRLMAESNTRWTSAEQQ